MRDGTQEACRTKCEVVALFCVVRMHVLFIGSECGHGEGGQGPEMSPRLQTGLAPNATKSAAYVICLFQVRMSKFYLPALHAVLALSLGV